MLLSALPQLRFQALVTRCPRGRTLESLRTLPRLWPRDAKQWTLPNRTPAVTPSGMTRTCEGLGRSVCRLPSVLTETGEVQTIVAPRVAAWSSIGRVWQCCAAIRWSAGPGPPRQGSAMAHQLRIGAGLTSRGARFQLLCRAIVDRSRDRGSTIAGAQTQARSRSRARRLMTRPRPPRRGVLAVAGLLTMRRTAPSRPSRKTRARQGRWPLYTTPPRMTRYSYS